MCIVALISRQDELNGLWLISSFGPMRGAGGTARPATHPIAATASTAITDCSTVSDPARMVPIRIER